MLVSWIRLAGGGGAVTRWLFKQLRTADAMEDAGRTLGGNVKWHEKDPTATVCWVEEAPLIVMLPVECEAGMTNDCSVPVTVIWPEPEVADCAPVPGSSTSMRRPTPSAQVLRGLPAWSATVVQLPEYEIETLLAKAEPSGGMTFVVRPRASYESVVVPSVGEEAARWGLDCFQTRPEPSKVISVFIGCVQAEPSSQSRFWTTWPRPSIAASVTRLEV